MEERTTHGDRFEDFEEPAFRDRRGRPLKKMRGEIVLDSEVGTRFYHKHKSPKAVARKKKARQLAKKSRKHR